MGKRQPFGLVLKAVGLATIDPANPRMIGMDASPNWPIQVNGETWI
jgi:hypothetical protein